MGAVDPSTGSGSTSRSISTTRCSPSTASREIDFSTTTFLKEISRARTFGFLRDIEISRKRPRARRILDNAIVMDDYRVLNEEVSASEDEFVRHKVLDAIGDLYLVGARPDRRVQRLQVRPPAQQSAGAAVARAARLLRGSRVRRGARAALAGFLPARDRRRTRRLALSLRRHDLDSHPPARQPLIE